MTKTLEFIAGFTYHLPNGKVYIAKPGVNDDVPDEIADHKFVLGMTKGFEHDSHHYGIPGADVRAFEARNVEQVEQEKADELTGTEEEVPVEDGKSPSERKATGVARAKVSG